MVTESSEHLIGNDAFEGYAIDLISEIAQILKFNYTFKWVDDGAYGYKNKETGEWNGLMGEILTQVGQKNKQTRGIFVIEVCVWARKLQLAISDFDTFWNKTIGQYGIRDSPVPGGIVNQLQCGLCIARHLSN